MIRKLFPLLLAGLGLGAGVGAGLYLRHDKAADDPAADTGAPVAKDTHPDTAEGQVPDFVKMSNQFVVPVVKDGRVAAMVVLSLTLEVDTGMTDAVFAREPKLRDMFLQVLFDHANVGGFSGSFTDGANLVPLRTNLREAAELVLEMPVHDVLITDIARQDT